MGPVADVLSCVYSLEFSLSQLCSQYSWREIPDIPIFSRYDHTATMLGTDDTSTIDITRISTTLESNSHKEGDQTQIPRHEGSLYRTCSP